MPYTILQADLKKDKETVISLWKCNFGWVPEGRYEWIYENNPSGRPAVFLLHHDKSNSIVGAISLFPRLLYLEGIPTRAWICGDLAVDQAHRTLGPAMKLLKAAVLQCKESESAVLLGFPNEKSEPVMRKAGFEVLDDLCEMTHVLRSRSYVKRYVPSPALSRMLSFPLDLLLRLRPMDLFQGKLKDYSIKVVDSTGAEMDSLWIRQVNHFCFMGERSGSYLDWRFMKSPYAEHRVFTVAAKSGKEPLGYIIFRVSEKRVQVVDIGFPAREEGLGILLSSFSRYQRSQGADSIALTLAGHPTLIEALRRNGYSMRSRENKILLYAPAGNRVMERIKSGNWYLTSADNDI